MKGRERERGSKHCNYYTAGLISDQKLKSMPDKTQEKLAYSTGSQPDDKTLKTRDILSIHKFALGVQSWFSTINANILTQWQSELPYIGNEIGPHCVRGQSI